VSDGKLADAVREAEQIRRSETLGNLAFTRTSGTCATAYSSEGFVGGIGLGFRADRDENVHLVRNLLDEVFGSETGSLR